MNSMNLAVFDWASAIGGCILGAITGIGGLIVYLVKRKAEGKAKDEELARYEKTLGIHKQATEQGLDVAGLINLNRSLLDAANTLVTLPMNWDTVPGFIKHLAHASVTFCASMAMGHYMAVYNRSFIKQHFATAGYPLDDDETLVQISCFHFHSMCLYLDVINPAHPTAQFVLRNRHEIPIPAEFDDFKANFDEKLRPAIEKLLPNFRRLPGADAMWDDQRFDTLAPSHLLTRVPQPSTKPDQK